MSNPNVLPPDLPRPREDGACDHHGELADLGVQVFGLSTQSPDYQREMAVRLHLPFEVLSDADLRFAMALRLPTFEAEGKRLVRQVVPD